MSEAPKCNFYWGSHSCYKDATDGHRIHECRWTTYDENDVPTTQVCCEYDEDAFRELRIRHADNDGKFSDWGDYQEGWRM